MLGQNIEKNDIENTNNIKNLEENSNLLKGFD